MGDGGWHVQQPDPNLVYSTGQSAIAHGFTASHMMPVGLASGPGERNPLQVSSFSPLPLLPTHTETHSRGGGSLATYTCRFTGCGKVYSSSDGVRKHCRKHHPEWLKEVEKSSRSSSTFCIKTSCVATTRRRNKKAQC